MTTSYETTPPLRRSSGPIHYFYDSSGKWIKIWRDNLLLEHNGSLWRKSNVSFYNQYNMDSPRDISYMDHMEKKKLGTNYNHLGNFRVYHLVLDRPVDLATASFKLDICLALEYLHPWHNDRNLSFKKFKRLF